MTSVPPLPASQRRSPPREAAEPASQHEQSQLGRTDSEAYSATSEDSQTLLLNSPHPPQAQRPVEQSQSQSHSQPHSQSQKELTAAPQPDDEPRKCWICFNDETEDEPTSSEWRSPCPCVLVAHEKCLLDWIADMEAPSSRRRAGGGRGKILCPQCKAEIKVVRPRSIVVDLVRTVERFTGMMLLPGFFIVVGSAVYSTATLLGTHAVYEVFGIEDGAQILMPIYESPTMHQSIVARAMDHLRLNWRLDLGLPLIPTVLIASRTTLADSFLPFLPLIFFASSGRPQDEMMPFQWPPSAAFTIAALPYIRGVYNAYYERVWLPKEQRWLKEIQPRAGDTDGNNGADNDNAGDQIEEVLEDGDDDAVIEAVELEVDFDLFGDWNNGGAADNNAAEENPPVPIARGPAPPLHAPPQDVDVQDAAPAPNVPGRRNRIRRERNMQFSTTSLADTILGALIFPSIAAAVGEVLKHALPKSWVTKPADGKVTGFLQARWGRSILGGCLFVGVKDVVMLYVRWKMAQNHRKRRVEDYDRSKKKIVRP
ncbi:uncharacterized protein BDR25DRAFT_282963 [Lindgomyces ingoldianus]|uniref:Uncharacterized protein n=1 Tax=Lindgomyces ingoldianus TaxID=673940 RepID=A0ACB6R4I1_9PLEO|nr:uncharacterized protein BDR25DRAFT_282963 [Lindgomyces ingoldianus]KAF2473427.1 hypothetical protein BDR25DRAFT_282963 [Lindgomyces ingoldianus]